MDIGALKLGIFAAFVVLFGSKAVRGLASTKTVVRNRAYGEVATKPIRGGLVAIATAAASFGGYWYAEFPYLWLTVAVINLFVAFLVAGQSHAHDRAAAMDTELALAMDQDQMAKKVRTRRWESVGQIAIILVWSYAWRNALEIA